VDQFYKAGITIKVITGDSNYKSYRYKQELKMPTDRSGRAQIMKLDAPEMIQSHSRDKLVYAHVS
jgi:hypothetical protein